MADGSLAGTPEVAVYVHFPWCVKKCPYCDFNSHPLKSPLDEAGYLSALESDLRAQLETTGKAVSSVFFGGGTPSLFAPKVFARILEVLQPRLKADAEITLEANPGTTEHRNLGDYRLAGINRLSLGAQSFNNHHLARLGRIHGADDIVRSFENARNGGFDNINLDVMYGLGGQTAAQAADDLQSALALQPEHMSWYQLTIEPRTEFAANPPRLPGETVLGQIERDGHELLAAHGFQRYEVSAYGKPGRRCAHNRNYWRFGDYLGVGAGSHGKLTREDGVVRTSKPRQPRLYLADPLATTVSRVEPDALAGEFVLNALRLVEGTDFHRFQTQTGLDPACLNPQWQRRVDEGLLRADRIATTGRGFEVLDSLVQDFLR